MLSVLTKNTRLKSFVFDFSTTQTRFIDDNTVIFVLKYVSCLDVALTSCHLSFPFVRAYAMLTDARMSTVYAVKVVRNSRPYSTRLMCGVTVPRSEAYPDI